VNRSASNSSASNNCRLEGTNKNVTSLTKRVPSNNVFDAGHWTTGGRTSRLQYSLARNVRYDDKFDVVT